MPKVFVYGFPMLSPYTQKKENSGGTIGKKGSFTHGVRIFLGGEIKYTSNETKKK